MEKADEFDASSAARILSTAGATANPGSSRWGFAEVVFAMGGGRVVVADCERERVADCCRYTPHKYK
eukprot:758663-Pleurochrysis_carterae.AAC.3